MGQNLSTNAIQRVKNEISVLNYWWFRCSWLVLERMSNRDDKKKKKNKTDFHTRGTAGTPYVQECVRFLWFVLNGTRLEPHGRICRMEKKRSNLHEFRPLLFSVQWRNLTSSSTSMRHLRAVKRRQRDAKSKTNLNYKVWLKPCSTDSNFTPVFSSLCHFKLPLHIWNICTFTTFPRAAFRSTW